MVEQAGGRVEWPSVQRVQRVESPDGPALPMIGTGPVPAREELPAGATSAGAVGSPGPGYEKVKVGNVWVWGKRNR